MVALDLSTVAFAAPFRGAPERFENELEKASDATSWNTSIVEAQEPLFAQNVTFIKGFGRVPTVRYSQLSYNSIISQNSMIFSVLHDLLRVS
jgi:hypothetical protein